MADLDDFFAKRDRKKGKAPVKKFSTPDEMAKKIEDTKQKTDVKVRKDRPPGQGQDGEDNGTMPGDEDEWREFEVAKKDYTGLKIQPLAAGEGGGGQGGGGNNDGSSGGSGAPQTAAEQRARGPWNKGEADQDEQQWSQAREREREREVSEQPAPPPPSSGASAPASGGYVPPHMRNRPPGSAGPSPIEPLRNSRTAKVHAPDIHSEEYFPTLGGDTPGKKTSGNSGGGAWTEAGGAGGGGRVAIGQQRPDSNTALQLGNRFTSLTHDS